MKYIKHDTVKKNDIPTLQLRSNNGKTAYWCVVYEGKVFPFTEKTSAQYAIDAGFDPFLFESAIGYQYLVTEKI
jgi:hypothetical protein